MIHSSIRRKTNGLPVQELKCDDRSEQTISGHNSSSRSVPIHKRPLFFGSGFVHVRVLDRNDFPHVLEQTLHSLHEDQPP